MPKIDFISSEPIEEKEKFLPYYLGATPKEAEQTYEHWSWLLGIMASNFHYNSEMSLEDLYAEAITGLARAKRDWDPTRGGCTFQTFVTLKVKNALNEACRRNNSIVSIPHYVRVAHTYITNIKTIYEGYGIPDDFFRKTIITTDQHRDRALADKDSERVSAELKKLKKLVYNTGVTAERMLERAEFVPSDMSYDETMTQGELHKREQQRLAAALAVSKLEDQMSEDELHVARGIMAGHSYGEIGRTHPNKYSIAWVQKTVRKMREKFQQGRNPDAK